MKIYKVGGYVRDKILGVKSKDIDWLVVGSTPEEMIKNGFTQVGKNFPVFIHPDTKEEYALARKEQKTGLGHKNFEFNFSPEITLEEDLARRDLTINAIAEDESGSLIDPFNGRSDIENKILRHVSDSFFEDPLRALRVCRFAATLPEFSIHTETFDALKRISDSGELKHLSRERVWDETLKALKGDFLKYLELIKKIGLDEPWFSGLENIPSSLPSNIIDKWCYVARENNFKFGENLLNSKDFSKRLALWKNLSILQDINDKNLLSRKLMGLSQNIDIDDIAKVVPYFLEKAEFIYKIIKDYKKRDLAHLNCMNAEEIKDAKASIFLEIIEKHE
ncbi:MAG: tRNA nucleotidyl transferase [Gammaproteobacteria bacterium]